MITKYKKIDKLMACRAAISAVQDDPMFEGCLVELSTFSQYTDSTMTINLKISIPEEDSPDA